MGAKDGSGRLGAAPSRCGEAMSWPCSADPATCWPRWQIGQVGLALHSWCCQASTASPSDVAKSITASSATAVTSVRIGLFQCKRRLPLVPSSYHEFRTRERHFSLFPPADTGSHCPRSEERRVGKECSCRWWPEQEK